MQELSEGGEASEYSPGASSALTQIGPYSAFLYTVFHSVFYNSVALIHVRVRFAWNDTGIVQMKFCFAIFDSKRRSNIFFSVKKNTEKINKHNTKSLNSFRFLRGKSNKLYRYLTIWIRIHNTV